MKLSICVCTRNRSAQVSRLLAELMPEVSVLDDVELVFVDNGSSDDTHEVLERASAAQDNVRCVRENVAGLSRARNAGLAFARGEYIAYLDDESSLCPGYIDIVRGWMARDVVAVGGPYAPLFIGEAPDWLHPSMVGVDFGNSARRLLDDESLCGTNMIFRRADVVAIGGFREDLGMVAGKVWYGEETELQLRLRRDHGAALWYDPELLVHHRVRTEKLRLRRYLFERLQDGRSAARVHDGPETETPRTWMTRVARASAGLTIETVRALTFRRDDEANAKHALARNGGRHIRSLGMLYEEMLIRIGR